MLELKTQGEAVVLPVRAQPGGRRNAIRGVQEGMLKVSVTQVAEKGKANHALAEVLCRQLQLRKSQIELVAGETSPQKRFLVRGITAADLSARIAAALPENERGR
ncbi:MAG: DUF167 domain-containing protein [Thermoguttaceae bacterium]|jgi:uncharacterized protein (TIGR00251 family)